MHLDFSDDILTTRGSGYVGHAREVYGALYADGSSDTARWIYAFDMSMKIVSFGRGIH